MRVHADEHDAHVLGLVAQVLQHGGQLRHGGGADVGATGVAEEQHDRLALEVVAVDGFAARAGQRELQVGQVALDVVERPVHVPIAAGGKKHTQSQQQAAPGAAGNEVSHESRKCQKVERRASPRQAG
ncbi:hypothetical protein D3C87_1703480 [compost metagenome]